VVGLQNTRIVLGIGSGDWPNRQGGRHPRTHYSCDEGIRDETSQGAIHLAGISLLILRWHAIYTQRLARDNDNQLRRSAAPGVGE
jgi:hypothetical protein